MAPLRGNQSARPDSYPETVRKWLLVSLALGLILLACSLWAPGLSAAEQARYLPTAEGIYIQLDSSVLRLFAGLPGTEENEYLDFVTKTGFDYRRDLDRLLAVVGPQGNYFAVTGRFDWNRITAYAGNCLKGLCTLPASQPGKWISLMMPRPGLLVIAVSTNQLAVGAMEKPLPKALVPWTNAPFFVTGSGKYFAPWGLSGESPVQVRLDGDAVVLTQGDITRRIDWRKILE